MQWLKSNFLRFSIHRQIQVGILSVSLFVCFLVLNLILINCFILISTSYFDVVEIFDKTESQQLEAVNLNIGINQHTISEISFLGIQWIRNFIDNLSRNNEFIINTDKFILRKYSPNGYIDCNYNMSKRNCAIYQTFNENDNDYFNKIVAMSYPFLNKSLDFKLFQIDSSTNIYNRVSIFSNDLKTLYTFPNTELSSSYNSTIFDKSVNSIVSMTHEFVKEYQNYNLTDTNNFLELSQSYKSLIKSPVIRSFVKKNYDPITIKEISYVGTFSPKFNFANVNNYSLLSQNEMINSVFGYWDSNIIDDLAFSSVNTFRGIKMIFTSFKEKDFNVITVSTCTYYLYLYKLFNPESNFTSKSVYNNITDCFNFPLAKETINSYLFNDQKYNDYIIRRKLHVPVLNDTWVNELIYFKFFKYMNPDYFTQSLLNSDFFTINKLHLYLLKTLKYMNQDKKAVFFKFTALLASIMMTNFMLWILVIVVIYINILRIINSITNPIAYLIKYLTSISKGKMENQVDLKIFNDGLNIDKDINDLFKICKQLIKGGYFFKNSNLNKSFDEGQKISYNNIAIIKSNNFIVDEKELEKSLKQSSYMIYNYRRSTNVIDYRLDTKSRESFDKYSENAGLLDNRRTYQDLVSKIKKEQQFFIRYNSKNEEENKLFRYVEFFVNNNPIMKKNFLFHLFKDEISKINIFDPKEYYK